MVNLILLTPPDPPTRTDPRTCRTSTLDLAIVTHRLADRATVTKGPYLGSDHIPILFYLNTKDKIKKQKVQPKWAFDKQKWPAWNDQLNATLISRNIDSIEDPVKSIRHVLRDDLGNIPRTLPTENRDDEL